MIPVGDLVANAVAAALKDPHVEPLSLPLAPDGVWRLIERADP